MKQQPNFEVNIRTLREILPKSAQLGIGEDFCLFDARYNAGRDNVDFGCPCKLDGNVVIFCIGGSINLSVNLNRYEIGDGDMIICTAGDILKAEIRQDVLAEDFRIIMIAMSNKFASDLRIDFKGVLNRGAIVLEKPVLKISETLKGIFRNYLSLIGEVTRSNLERRTDAVRSLVSSMMSLAAGQWLSEVNKVNARTARHVADTRSSHKRSVFEQFMNLVSEHYPEQRQVAFYADRLCLSPKYLSKLVKEVSGKSAPEWIDSYVMLEAKNLLKYSDMPVKEVVYRLNFSNQTAFYKYFKAHSGMTPTEYRNS